MKLLLGLAQSSALALLISLPASPLLSQSGNRGQVELGMFGTFTRFDDTSIGLTDEYGAGARLGVFLSRMFSIEASGDFTTTRDLNPGTEVSVSRVGGTILGNLSYAGSNAFYIGAGYERVMYRTGYDIDDNGIHGILGTRLSLGGRAALRVEGRATYFPDAAVIAGQTTALNLGATAGISVFAFGGPPKDADADGVRNSGDRCPNTPIGAVVDERGCPIDGDRDGVFDGLDRCPDTPSGATVDEFGCPSDDDDDGVFNGIDVCADTPVAALVDEAGCPSDADNDLVFDGLDACPDTPAGATVDSFGCESDEDRDGVLDGIDRCPATPFGTVVDETGCPLDSDQDGITDDVDACLDTPEGAVIDESGCRVTRDSDGDGVDDSRDRCPDTPVGRQVDQIGCPVLFEIREGEVQPLVLQGVTFATARSTLTAESAVALDQVAASLVANPTVRIEIAGHTDGTGRRSFNLRLSVDRAESVRNYLVQQGVDSGRLVARGYGPDRPIDSNRTREGRRHNRRVELHLLER